MPGVLKAARCARRGPALAPASAFFGRGPAGARRPHAAGRRWSARLTGMQPGCWTMPSSSAIHCPAPGRRV